jgi:deoxyribonuclease (pyrimidine dimer)
MTRVNAAIRASELSNSMLFAEYREIKRIPNTIKSGKAVISNIPKDFKLSTNHVKFFYDKILYLKKRSDELYQELIKRNYNIEDYSSCYEDIPKSLFNDWVETKEARELLKVRINQRLSESKKPIKYFDKIITLEEALIK